MVKKHTTFLKRGAYKAHTLIFSLQTLSWNRKTFCLLTFPNHHGISYAHCTELIANHNLVWAECTLDLPSYELLAMPHWKWPLTLPWIGRNLTAGTFSKAGEGATTFDYSAAAKSSKDIAIMTGVNSTSQDCKKRAKIPIQSKKENKMKRGRKKKKKDFYSTLFSLFLEKRNQRCGEGRRGNFQVLR